MIELKLPYPPSVNHYKNIGRLTRTKKGKIFQMRVNSPKTLQFYCDVMNISLREGVKDRIESTIPIEVVLCLHPPSNHRADIDNRIKVTLDSLVHAKVIPDDSQIARLVVERCEIIKHGQIIVRISELK